MNGKVAAAYVIFMKPTAEGSHNGSAAVLKTAGRKAMQVRVLSPPPFQFTNLPLLSSYLQTPSVPVATWRDLGALWALVAFGRNGNGSLFNESTAVHGSATLRECNETSFARWCDPATS